MLTYTGSVSAIVRVYWGKTDGGKDTGAWANSYEFGQVSEFVPLTHQIVVDQGSLYYYRFYATNAADEEGWAPESSEFRTFAAPGLSTLEGAGVGIISAVLNGKLTAGVEAEIWADWGGPIDQGVEPVGWTTVDLGTRTEEGTLEAPNPFKVRLDTLSPATTYAYRLRATNEYGSTVSPCVWFTTRQNGFVENPDSSWFGGGWFDGYYLYTMLDEPVPEPDPGTFLRFF